MRHIICYCSGIKRMWRIVFMAKKKEPVVKPIGDKILIQRVEAE